MPVRKSTVNLAIILSLAMTTLLSGCTSKNSTNNSSSILVSSKVSSIVSQSVANNQSSQNAITSSSDSQSALSSSSAKLSKVYFKTDSTKSVAYNAAIKAYNEFLNGNIDAKDLYHPGIWDGTINIKVQMTTIDNKPGIADYALLDVNNDGIPELLTSSNSIDVFSYQNNQVEHWFNTINIEDGPITICSNGAIFNVHITAGTEYYYTTFGKNGTIKQVYFSAIPTSYTENDYFFIDTNTPISKADYDKLTAPYFKAAKKPASIKWMQY